MVYSRRPDTRAGGLMQDYQVPKEKASVLIEMPPHEPETRFIFLSPYAQSHHGAETPSDIFNVPQAYLPLFRDDGDVVLARHDAITWVMVGEPRRTEWYYYETRQGVPETAVHLEFDTGGHIDGRVALVGPAGGQRVLDIVNRQEGFLHVERDDELFLVNLKRVISITLKVQ
jgi:hypothetical protein